MSYLATVQADSPVHYWRLLEGGGRIAHDIGSNPLHLVASDASMLGYSAATSDGGSMFDPQNQSISSLANLQTLASPLSIECVVWPTGTPASNGFAVAWDGVNTDYVGLLYLTTLKFAFNVHTASLIGATVFSPQTWHHVVGTWDNTTAKLYVDGAQDATQAVAGPHTYANKIGIGGVPGTSAQSLQSCISDVAIYSTALSAARVSAHFAALDQRASNPTFVYPLGNGAVSSVGSGTPPPDISQILNAVRRTFPTT